MRTIRIPSALREGAGGEDGEARRRWLVGLAGLVDEIASDWELELDDPYVPGGVCAWVAPARGARAEELVLKVGWRHPEAEHEADGLRHWDGAGAVRCLKTRTLEDSAVLLLERCVPGTPLSCTLPELEQDLVIARLLRRLWSRPLPPAHGFGSLGQMCQEWAESFELSFAVEPRGLDPGIARTGITLLRELPASAPGGEVLLCTDLHAGNVLAATREPWLVIDPKPAVGDPAFDAVQHMLNCEQRLARDPLDLARRMAGLLEVDPERVRLWLLARCAQEALHNHALREPARRLAD